MVTKPRLKAPPSAISFVAWGPKKANAGGNHDAAAQDHLGDLVGRRGGQAGQGHIVPLPQVAGVGQDDAETDAQGEEDLSGGGQPDLGLSSARPIGDSRESRARCSRSTRASPGPGVAEGQRRGSRSTMAKTNRTSRPNLQTRSMPARNPTHTTRILTAKVIRKNRVRRADAGEMLVLHQALIPLAGTPPCSPGPCTTRTCRSGRRRCTPAARIRCRYSR